MEEKEKCKFPDGITIKPDGETELDPCRYRMKSIYKNVTLAVLECMDCGHIEIEWIRQPNTERITEDEYEETLMEQIREK